jgi:hypothetical protein
MSVKIEKERHRINKNNKKIELVRQVEEVERRKHCMYNHAWHKKRPIIRFQVC